MSYTTKFNFLSLEEKERLRRIANDIHWESGRQRTGYMKAVINKNHDVGDIVSKTITAMAITARLDYCPTKFDCYILKYPEGSSIPYHRDDAPFKSKHWRLNAIISSPDEYSGGELVLEDRYVEMFSGDAVIFRPDRIFHAVTKVTEGTRYVWSVGMLT